MEIETYPLGEMQTNAYLLADSGEALIIDPADEGGFLIQKVLERKLTCKYILATHGHFDHLLGLLEVKLTFNCPFLIHRADLPLLKRHSGTAAHFLEREVDPVPEPDGFLGQNQKIILGETTLRVLETPGHTLGSVSFYGDEALFSGDTIFAHGDTGRTDLPDGSEKKLTASIQNKLLVLPGDTVVFPGHGPATTIGDFSLEWQARLS